ncbi:LCP family protein [Bifidobacterium sp. H1HS16N]|uniref:LCP family protein n=1 Tax=Bifidobacterium kimbladii TaxID=1293826 RepID=A0ABU3KGH1_9BIFI|nr:LCP family protein [Bifidobacterium sp. H1HS16N]MDT7509881.1 LCP family protein [Bifidobacterium sp. H1HS16N]
MTSPTRKMGLPNIKAGRNGKPQHSDGFRSSHRLRTGICLALTFVLCFVASTVAAFWTDINGHMHVLEPVSLAQTHKAPEDIYKGKTLNVLVLGQDTRDGKGNAEVGGSGDGLEENHQSDTAMVVQIAADRSYVNVVSIPRDSIVNAPACTTSKGETIPARRQVMFNSIFAEGYNQGGDANSAASCSMAAVRSLTGLDIQQFVVADFNGLKSIIDALGGVDVCIPKDTWDGYTGINLKRGLQHLDGTQATEYARMRHGTGADGSDIMRTTRQQYLIKSLVNEAKAVNIYSDLPKAYRLATTSMSTLQLSEGLGSFQTLLGLGNSLKHIDTTHIYARTIPVEEWSQDSNRVVWTDEAETIWHLLREGKPLTQANEAAESASSSGSQAGNGQDAQDAAQTAGNGSDTGDGTQSPSASAAAAPKPDPRTGLITMPDKTLIDPNTGGTVDPDDGTIKDANTGQYIGMADRYLFATVCAVPAQR